MAATPESIRALARAAPMDDVNARQDIYNAARELMFAVEPPFETDNRIFFAYAPLAFAQMAEDLKLFSTLAADINKQWSVDELATELGADPILLHRILRYLSAQHLIAEPAASTYQASHITPHVATAGFAAGLKHNTTFVNRPFAALPEVLRENGYKNLVGAKNCAFQRGLGTNDDIMEFLSSHPVLAEATFGYMAAHKAAAPTWMNGAVPTEDFKLSQSDIEAGRVMIVDVGGGSGHQMFALRKNLPELKGRLVLQDMAVMIDQVDQAAAREAGVEAVAHDFWTPQPVKGAKVYYLRTVLHDWPDAECRTILKHLREAVAEDSVIVIDESVIPDQGASIAQMNFDITMLAAAGAMGRSEQQWRELLHAAGLKIRNIWFYDQGMNSGLIVAVPA